MLTVLRLPTCLVAWPIALNTIASLPNTPTVDDVVSRVVAYLSDYEKTLSGLVAVETYEQQQTSYTSLGRPTRRKRLLKSDFSFMRLPGNADWLGFRDTFLVNGTPVRDRGSRVLELLSEGRGDTFAEARRLVTENARYNLGDVPRTINSPTQSLDLISSRYRSRFAYRKDGEDKLNGRRWWRIQFRETVHPSIIRTRDGADQMSRVTVWVDPATGAVAKTALDIDGERASAFVQTKITVTYVVDPTLGFLVPLSMVEAYYRPKYPDYPPLAITAVAKYGDFRQFQVTGRLIEDR